MKVWRVFVPGVGYISVEAAFQDQASKLVQQYLLQNGISLEQGATIGVPVISTAQKGDIFIKNPMTGGFTEDQMKEALANVSNTVAGGQPSSTPTSGASTGEVATAPAATAPTFKSLAGATPQNLLERELADPAAAFRSVLQGSGISPTGMLGNRFQALANPAFATRQLQEALGMPGVGENSLSQTFSNFLSGAGGGTRNIGAAALQALQALGGLRAPNAAQEIFTRPESYGSESAEIVRDVALAALGGRSPFLASRFGNQIDQNLASRFGDVTFNQQQPDNFARFLSSQLGF